MPRLTHTPDNRGLAILVALGKLGKHVYAGTVPTAVVDRRRAVNRAARRARRITRAAR